MGKYCSNCGNELMGNEKYCTVCGTTIVNCSNAVGVPVYRNGEVIGYNPSYSNEVKNNGDGYAIASFVLSLASIFFSSIFAIISLIFAHLAVKEGTNKKGFVLASRIISIIDIVIFAIIIGSVIVITTLLMINDGPYH